MSIEFQCPACNKPYRLADEYAGKAAKCSCGTRLTVPKLVLLLDESDLVDEEVVLEPVYRSAALEIARPSRDYSTPFEEHQKRVPGGRWSKIGATIVGMVAAAIAFVVVILALKDHGRPAPKPVANAKVAPAAKPPENQNLLEARQGFTTNLVPNRVRPAGPAVPPPDALFLKVHYKSEVGDLLAYVTPDPGDGKKHAAMLWCHDGFGGIGDEFWKPGSAQNDQTGAFRQTGIVVMCPSWRGEGNNPGQFEMCYGEVNDLFAAANYLASLPYVDPDRIYVGGHGVGGTMTLLEATASDRFRATFAFGGTPDIDRLTKGKDAVDPPFDVRSSREFMLRSAVNFTSAIRTPTFYFDDLRSNNRADVTKMEASVCFTNVPFTTVRLFGAGRANMLPSVKKYLADQINRDTGPTCQISISSFDINRLVMDDPNRFGSRANEPSRSSRRSNNFGGFGTPRGRSSLSSMLPIKLTPAANTQLHTMIAQKGGPAGSNAVFVSKAAGESWKIEIDEKARSNRIRASFRATITFVDLTVVLTTNEHKENVRYQIDYNAAEEKFVVTEIKEDAGENELDSAWPPGFSDDLKNPFK